MAIYWRGILRYASIVTLVACRSLGQVVTGEGGTPTEHGAAMDRSSALNAHGLPFVFDQTELQGRAAVRAPEEMEHVLF